MAHWRTIVIDDDHYVRGLLKELVALRNHNCIALDPTEKCPLLKEHTCRCNNGWRCADFLITDIYMPNLNGLEWVKTQQTRGCCVPRIAVISGHWGQAQKQEAQHLGCTTFEKPFNIQRLDAWLAEGEKETTNHAVHAEWFKDGVASR